MKYKTWMGGLSRHFVSWNRLEKTRNSESLSDTLQYIINSSKQCFFKNISPLLGVYQYISKLETYWFSYTLVYVTGAHQKGPPYGSVTILRIYTLVLIQWYFLKAKRFRILPLEKLGHRCHTFSNINHQTFATLNRSSIFINFHNNI